jgi:fucokinase
MREYNNPRGDCSLLKCALIYLGLTTAEEILAYPSRLIQQYLNKFCQSEKLGSDFGLEIISASLLPTGSGMGGSSILGGCIVAAIARCIGVTLCNDNLVHAVLMLEQMLTTGGGWQDQIGGLIGGLKLGISDANVVLKTKVIQYNLTPSVRDELSRRLALVFTGKPRLAKDILQNVLRRWARRKSDIVSTVQELVCGASEAVDSLMEGDFNRLGSCMSSYWEHKKIMAGLESGVEPDFVKSLLAFLHSRGDVVGGTLCGAGGEYM